MTQPPTNPEPPASADQRPSIGNVIFYSLLMVAFAIWFGGFTFYVSVVVPIGTDILGSARAQGQITQQVAPWLNYACLLATTLMFFDGWKRTPGIQNWNFWIIACLLISTFVLFYFKHRLDGLIEPTESSIRVVDRDVFYSMHRVYLWTSTLQWLLGWGWIVLFCRNVRFATKDD